MFATTMPIWYGNLPRCHISGKLKVYIMSVSSGAYQFKEEKRLQHMVFDGGTRLRLAVPLGTSVFKTERVVQGFGDGGDEFVAGYTNALEKKFPDLQNWMKNLRSWISLFWYLVMQKKCTSCWKLF